jgi:carbon-monoxide dehydrogenase large subunit
MGQRSPSIGARLRRREDPRLITGRGRYAGDISAEGLLHLAIARSVVPHGRITSLDIEAAKSVPGVVAVFTRDDLPESARDISEWLPRGMTPRPRTVLAGDEVNYVGEAIAAVVASTPYAAADAAAAIFADIDPLPGVGTVEEAMQPDAPKVHEGADSNEAGGFERGYGDIEAAFRDAPVTASERFVIARIEGAAMEPRAVTAEPLGDGLRVWTSTQHTFGVRDRLANTLGLPKDEVEVLAEDVGGGFGPKAQFYPEEILTGFAALRLGRPVRWSATRSEDGATTVHAHGLVVEAEIAAEKDGRLRGLRGRMYHDIGAYPAAGPGQPGIIIAHMLSAYHLPALHFEAVLVHTNTGSTGFVRGGGRPIGNYVIERMVDRVARAAGLDPAEVRRRNLVRAEEMPYDTGYPAGKGTVVYDSGDYAALLEAALGKAAYEDIRRQQNEPRNGRLLGVGVACCVESSGFGVEQARVVIGKDGIARAFVGSTPQGQSHVTTTAQVVADRLSWPLDRVEVVAGDTRVLGHGEMTAGSRTAVQVGNAAAAAARSARTWLLEHAAEKLEAAAEDLVMEGGVISVRGAPASSVDATEVVPEEGLEVEEGFQAPAPYANAYSSGAHVAVVEVEPETGSVTIKRYVIAHDTGRAINPMVVEGQIQGGYAHGLGYALFEEALYASDGTFTGASFLDYTIASAPEVSPAPEIVTLESDTPHNPEGFKGAGESGTIPVPAAISNAVEDALRQARPDARVHRLPVTPQAVFEALG